MPGEPPPGGLRDVSDTAFWVAAYRAEESERPDALFHDPFAARLAGERGPALLDAIPKGRKLAWPMVLRTVLFDRMIQECVESGADLVVNLAAGLDARPYRMPLPASLRWVEVDLPAMIEHKSAILAGERPACSLERVALDLSDGGSRRRLLADLGASAGRILFLSEGLLIYLEREQVAALAADLAAPASARWWITDLVSPGLLRMLGKTWGSEVERARAPFRFAPEEGPEFFRAADWSALRIEEPFRAAARAKRLSWPLRLLARLPAPRRFNPGRPWSGTCLFERVGREA